MSAQTPAKITLEEITQRKKKLLNEIQAQKRAMTATTREIFSPLAPAANKADSLMRSFNTGMGKHAQRKQCTDIHFLKTIHIS